MTAIEKHWAAAGSLRPKLNDPSLHYGWLVQYQVNAKNRYGGYVGMKGAAVFIANGKLIDHYDNVTSGGYDRWSKNLHQWQ